LSGRAVFVVLNRATMALFLNENVDNVVATLTLSRINIPKRPDAWDTLHCF